MPPSNQDLRENSFVPKENVPAASSVVKARPERPAPDPRRQIAQMAAKARWAVWAGKKAL
jgi:hypothetical protein